jgi:hypothetical protein
MTVAARKAKQPVSCYADAAFTDTKSEIAEGNLESGDGRRGTLLAALRPSE